MSRVEGVKKFDVSEYAVTSALGFFSEHYERNEKLWDVVSAYIARRYMSLDDPDLSEAYHQAEARYRDARGMRSFEAGGLEAYMLMRSNAGPGFRVTPDLFDEGLPELIEDSRAKKEGAPDKLGEALQVVMDNMKSILPHKGPNFNRFFETMIQRTEQWGAPVQDSGAYAKG